MPNPELLIQRASRLAPAIQDCRAEIDSQRKLPGRLVDALRSAGMFRLFAPAKFGGCEADPITFVKVVEELSRVDASVGWVVSVCSVSLRLSQAKTLAILVTAAMRVQRISLANIGRAMNGAAKHQIKRCWRFCANDRVETADAMRGIVAKLLKKRKKKLLIALDWVDIKGFQTLLASAVLKGRSTPLAWVDERGRR